MILRAAWKRPAILGAVFCAGLVLRFHVVNTRNFGWPAGWGGEVASVASAMNQGRGFADPYWRHTGPTALVPPVYPVMLAGLFRVFGDHTIRAGQKALWLDALFSAAVTPILYWLGSRLAGTSAGFAAAFLWGLWPLSGYSEALYVGNTSMYALALSGAFLLGVHRSSWFAPAAAAALLIDPSAAISLLLLVLWLSRKHPHFAWTSAVLCALPLVAWAVRNQVVVGRFTARSGLALELSRGIMEYDPQHFSDVIPLPNRDPEELEAYAAKGEIAYMDSKMSFVSAAFKADPWRYARIAPPRVLEVWTGAPWELSYLYGPLNRWLPWKRFLVALPGLLALCGLFFLPRDLRMLFAGIMLFQPAIYYFTHVDGHCRAPMEPLLMLAGGVAIAGVLGKIRSRV